MSWKVRVSLSALKFLKKERHLTHEKIFELVEKATCYFRGEDVNIDIKKLGGKWIGFYRIRKGKIRIIAEFDFDNSAVFVEAIDWRGNVYK